MLQLTPDRNVYEHPAVLPSMTNLPAQLWLCMILVTQFTLCRSVGSAGAMEDCINPNWGWFYFICPMLQLPSSVLERNRRKCLCAGTHQLLEEERSRDSDLLPGQSVSNTGLGQWCEQGQDTTLPISLQRGALDCSALAPLLAICPWGAVQ